MRWRLGNPRRVSAGNVYDGREPVCHVYGLPILADFKVERLLRERDDYPALANAALIVGAPEMRDALQRIHDDPTTPRHIQEIAANALEATHGRTETEVLPSLNPEMA